MKKLLLKLREGVYNNLDYKLCKPSSVDLEPGSQTKAENLF